MIKTVEDRFHESYIPEPNSGCWLWIRKTRRDLYGEIKIGKKTLSAHRVSWVLYNGEIPKGMFVCHKCDVPCCVNPEHLFLGTPRDNVHDMIRKNRNKRLKIKKDNHCQNGHKLTKNNIYTTKDKIINCKRCIAAASLRYYHANKEVMKSKQAIKRAEKRAAKKAL